MKVYNILLLEDSATDADLVKRVIKTAGIPCNFYLADNKDEYLLGLQEFKPDMILSDHTLPMFNSKMAFKIAKETNPTIPFLLVTGTVSEEFAVEMIKNGVDDYLLKSNLQRLPLAISNAFAKKANEEKLAAIRSELQQSETHLRSIFNNTTSGIILLDKQGNILELNNRTNYFTTYFFNTQLKKNEHLLEQLANYRKEAFAQAFTSALQGQTIIYETTYQKGNDEKIYFNVQLYPIVELTGNIAGACINFEDITQQKKAQLALRESNLLNTSILASIRSHIAVVDENGVILEVNDAWKEFSKDNGEPNLNKTGKGQNYFTVCQHAILSGDAIAQKVLLGLLDVSQSIIPFFEMVYPCHSPTEEHWFQLVATKFIGDSKKLVLKHTDISLLTKANKNLADYKHALYESSLVDISDKDGTIQHANANFCKLSKYSEAELIGQNHRLLNSGYHPKSVFQHLWSTINAGKIWRNEIRNKAKDGTYFWTDSTIVPFLDSNGKPFQFITIRKDISQRKNAESQIAEAIVRYDILASATSDTIYDWDIVNNKMYYNDGVTTMFGYEETDVKMIADWWKNNIYIEDYKNISTILADAFEKKLEKVQLSYRFRCADGSFKYIFDRARIIFNAADKPIRMIGAMQDITFQIEEEMRLSKAIIDAQEQERNFLATELHDNINQILVVALMTLGMTKNTTMDIDKRTKLISTAKAQITNAVNEIRLLSHSLATTNFKDNSLKSVFEKLLLLINIDKQFTITFDFDGKKEKNIPENIKINLYRILQEQTKNILNHAAANSIEIGVKIVQNAVTLRIYDNGKGFDVKAAKTGIGLSNIKKRAESLSGKFILNSAPGKGCEIIVKIPLGN